MTNVTPELSSNQPARLLGLPAVLGRLTIGKSKFYAGIKAGLYPKPKRIGGRVAWLESDITALIESLPTAE